MKVWIIASTPFVKDFERIASKWPKDIDYTITPIANFAITIRSAKFFYNTYKEISPDIILTDHGYIGFLPILFRKKLGKGPKVFFFLRGNYWLEEKSYFKNISKFTSFNITISAPKENEINLFDSHNIKFFYYNLFEKSGRKTVNYLSIFPGSYKIKAGKTEKTVSLSKSEEIKIKDVEIRIVKNASYRSKLKSVVEFIRTIVSVAGWRIGFLTADTVIPVCEKLGEEAKNNIKNNISVCPIPVEPIDFSGVAQIDLKHPAAVIIQNHQIKQKSEALIGIKDVIKELKNVTFYISRGLPENRNENYISVINALEDLPNVEFVDIDGSNKFSYLKSADIYLLPTGLDYTPATVLEAGQAEKPIVASRIGGIPEMIKEGETGWTIEKGDNKTWTTKIQEIINNPTLAKKMGQNARKNVLENYSIEKISKQILNIFEN